MNFDKFISLKDLAKIMGISRTPILTAIKRNELPKPVKIGNRVLFSMNQLKKFINITIDDRQ